MFLGISEIVGRSTACLLYLDATFADLRVAKASFHRVKRVLTWASLIALQFAVVYASVRPKTAVIIKKSDLIINILLTRLNNYPKIKLK